MGLQTALFQIHQSEGAKMVDFAGWDMPLQYTSITTEHNVVRAAAGIFDVSHMGRFFISGATTINNLNQVVVSDISQLINGQTKYTAVCNPEGGTKDDVLVTRLDTESYLVVVNASNREKLWDWFQSHFDDQVKFTDQTKSSSMIAIQGPKSLEIINQLFDQSFDDMAYYTMQNISQDIYVSRTGYTGEDGFEIIAPHETMLTLWKQARELGAMPTGLGCRDSLRLEMGMALYGHELDENITPLEAGLKWIVDIDKPAFIGKEALQKQLDEGVPRRKVCFVLQERGIPRQAYKIVDQGTLVGEVSSGGFSPILSQGIGMGFVKSGHTKSETLAIEIRGKQVPISVVKPPFVNKRTKT